MLFISWQSLAWQRDEFLTADPDTQRRVLRAWREQRDRLRLSAPRFRTGPYPEIADEKEKAARLWDDMIAWAEARATQNELDLNAESR